MSSSVRDQDHGYAQLMKGLDEARKGIVATVGIHAEEGGAGDGSSSVIQVAEWMEFGTTKRAAGPVREGKDAPRGEAAPPRPFVSAWADERGQKAIVEIRDAMAVALKGGSSPAKAVDRLAQSFAGEIQGRIADGIPPPNAPSTIAKKGSSTPLVNTGQLRGSIRGKVESK